MDKQQLFQFLSTQDSSVLLDALNVAYDQMDRHQRQIVFGQYIKKLPPAPVEGNVLLDDIERFYRESFAGVYYAPFNIDSKNWTYIPDETAEWFENLGDFLKASCQLTTQGDHRHAIACFDLLHQLIKAMEDGQAIVFGDEIGSWMIPGDEKQYIAAYMISLAATTTPEEFTAAALPFIRRDSRQSFATQAYVSAIHAANEAQQAYLESEIQHHNIQTRRRL